MNKRRWCLVGLAVLVTVVMFSGAVAASKPEIERDTTASSGVVANNNFVLHATVGESVAGPMEVVGANQVGSGFWQRLPEDFRSFLPSLLSSD